MKDQPPDKSEELSPYDRFREFARRIIAVPKAEIDEQSAEYEIGKQERKRLRAQKGAR